MSNQDLTEEEIFKYTQGLRKNLVDTIVQDSMPKDKDSQQVLLSALADMDRTALGNKRIGSTEKIAASDRLVADAVRRITVTYGTEDPFKGKMGTGVNGNVEAPTPDKNMLPEANAVPGETDIGVSEIKYDEFVAQFDADNK